MRASPFSIAVAALFGLALFSVRVEAGEGFWTASAGGWSQTAGRDACNALETTSAGAYAECSRSWIQTNTPPLECVETVRVEGFAVVVHGLGYRANWQVVRSSGLAPACTTGAIVMATIEVLITDVMCDGEDVWNAETGECMSPTSCDGSVTGDDFWRPVFSASDTGDICHESSQCKLSAVNVQDLNGSEDALVRFVGTAEGCLLEPEVPMTSANSGTQCISSGGDTWCTEPDLADENCGYFNEEFLCLNSVPEGNCVFYGNGDMACGASAGSPPAPDDGVTPGTKATPDGTITNNTNDIDIFNNTTVSGSSGATSGSGGGPGGSSGDGPPEALEVDLDLSPIIEDEPDSAGFDDGIETAKEGLEGELDGILDELADPSDFGGETSVNDDISTAMGILPCADLDVSVPGHAMTLTCADAAPIRDWLRWVCGILFLLGMFNLVTQRPVAR